MDGRAATVRERAVRRFASAFDGDEDLAAKLEIVTWNWAVKTCERDGIPLYWDEPRFRYRYTTRVLGLDFNLRNPRNPELKRRVLLGAHREGGIGLKKLASMTPQQMFPELWEDAYQRVAVRQLRREASARPEQAPEGAHTCRRCKSKKTVYTTVQIRSADEPMTIFVTCLACNKNWKE